MVIYDDDDFMKKDKADLTFSQHRVVWGNNENIREEKETWQYRYRYLL
jgi:FtsZ-binding cell division protein ZapB